MEDVILKWPEHTALYAFLTGGAFFGTFLLIFLYLYFSARRRMRIEAIWSRLYHQAIHKKVPPEEMRLLRDFFQTLGDGEQELLFAQPDLFRRLLLVYLARRGEDNRVRVHMISTLFPSAAIAHEVRGIDDLFTEETGSFEIAGHNLLVKIEEKRFSEIVLYSDTPFPTDITKGDAASLYLFRPGLGGFLLGGRITLPGLDRIVFAFDGTIDYFGEIHLMGEISVLFTAESWPEFRLAAGPAPAKEVGPPETGWAPPVEELPVTEGIPRGNNILRLNGETIRISDRAALVRFIADKETLGQELLRLVPYNTEVDGSLIPDEALFRRQETWLIRMVLPGGFHFSEQARIIPVPGRRGYYVIRYDHVPAPVKKGLLNEIKSAGALKERLI